MIKLRALALALLLALLPCLALAAATVLVGLAALWCISLLFRSDAITDDEI